MSTLYKTISNTPVFFNGAKSIFKTLNNTVGGYDLNALPANDFHTIPATPLGISTPDATLDSNGMITMKYNGIVLIDIAFKPGRTSGLGEGSLYFYLSVNGITPSTSSDNFPTLVASITDNGNFVDFHRSIFLNVEDGDTIEPQLATEGSQINNWLLHSQVWSQGAPSNLACYELELTKISTND